MNVLCAMLSALLFLPISSKGASPPPTSGASAPNPQQLEAVARSKEWLRLLHFRRSFPLFQWKSQVDGKDFFFSERGPIDPLSELQATIAALSKNEGEIGKLKQSPRCAFPARDHFIQQRLGLDFGPLQCPKLEEFLAKFGAESVTLVFSSAYPNNPASMFGHTFLRINSRSSLDNRQKADLLDYGVNFAAVVSDDENTIAFMALGLLGGYPGQFSAAPFHSKVEEYSNQENRDLWEYTLSLSPSETDLLLRHVWELETNSYFDYFFFDENCSFILLTVLEAVKPDWDLARFKLFAIPAETVKQVNLIPGAITKIRFRPSSITLLKSQIQKLTAKEQDAFFALYQSFDQMLLSQQSASVLDTLLAALIYRKKFDAKRWGSVEETFLKAALIRRSSLREAVTQEPETRDFSPADIALEEFSAPHLGHAPSKMSLGVGWESGRGKGLRSQGYGLLQYKFAYHDLLNADLGYLPFSQVDFPGVTLRLLETDKKIFVEQAQALQVISLFPLSRIQKQPSWRIGLDYYNPQDFGCERCHLVRLEAMAGAALSPQNSIILFLLAGPNWEFGKALPSNIRGGLKATLGAGVTWSSKLKTLLQAHYQGDYWQKARNPYFLRYEAALSISLSKNSDLRLQLERTARFGLTERNFDSSQISWSIFR